MTKDFLTNILACPKCKTALQVINTKGFCPKCRFAYQKRASIWHFLYLGRNSAKSQQEYERMHQEKFAGPQDGSYEILAIFARGNKTVDIACGDGYIEQLAPKTVGVYFSPSALAKAQRNGAKYLVAADAHNLPFKNDSFDLSISAGNLEHFADPQKAIAEMARISRVQILIVHKELPLPFGRLLFNLATATFKVKHQPIEKPISENQILKMIGNAGLHVVFRGVWTIPVNYGQVLKFLPEFKEFPACSFIISIKK